MPFWRQQNHSWKSCIGMENPSLWVLAFAQGTLYETTQNDTDYLGITCFLTWGYCGVQHFDSESCNEHGMDQTSGSQTMGRVQNNLFFCIPAWGRAWAVWMVCLVTFNHGRSRKNWTKLFQIVGSWWKRRRGFPHKAAASKRFQFIINFPCPKKEVAWKMDVKGNVYQIAGCQAWHNDWNSPSCWEPSSL
jgi:hypothetical protein